MTTIQDRLRMIMKMHTLNSSGFADKIGVQRSSLSHILSGRNKPSIDFIEKTLASFPRVNADWLITGVMKGKTETMEPRKEPEQQHAKLPLNPTEMEQKSPEKKSISRIIVFYSDGTFEETHPK